MSSEETYYLMFEDPIVLDEPFTFDINNHIVTINWKKHSIFNYYYHKELLFTNKFIILHTEKLIQRLEKIYNKKINYRLSEKLVRFDPSLAVLGGGFLP
jgi:hypothetical protein